MTKNMKKVAVIGAGAAGLTATKRVTEPGSGLECVTFELADDVGGTWVYTDNVGLDDYGVPVHSSMYQGLRTNLPKEIMELPDFNYNHPEKSYLTAMEVLQYFQDFADHFNLKKYIKFRHYVKAITPIPNGRWKIDVADLKGQKNDIYYFDAVIVCVGNYSNPMIPKIAGVEKFTGVQMHSHDYKEPSKFKDQRVIVIGFGASGVDVAFQVSTVASQVYLSHHSDKTKTMQFPKNLLEKPDVREIGNGTVIFKDGSEVIADAIVYCTGYIYNYPFLSPECKITVNNMMVKPLYKQIINIEHPTMGFVGIPRYCPAYKLFDLQASCFLNTINGKVQLPSKDDMYAELENDMKERIKVPNDERNYHSLRCDFAKTYFDSLSEFAGLPFAKPVIFDIYFNGLELVTKDYFNFRNGVFTLINDHEYEVKNCVR